MADPYSLSTSVDLSRLPPPTIVEQLSYENILAARVARMVELLPTFDATVDSDPAVKLLQESAYRELLLRQQFNDRARQVMPAYAKGANLDQLAVLVGVQRLELDPGNPAQGIPPTYEDDAALLERIILAPERFTVAGPEGAYIALARSANATIRDASATSPSPGEVLIALLSAVGDGTATAEQIEDVEVALGIVAGNKVRPLTDHVTVASATIVPYTINARLTVRPGPDQTLVLANAQAGLAAWLAQGGKLGDDAVRAAITAALFVEGVQNVQLVQPAADIVVDLTRTAHCVGVNVSVVGVGG